MFESPSSLLVENSLRLAQTTSNHGGGWGKGARDNYPGRSDHYFAYTLYWRFSLNSIPTSIPFISFKDRFYLDWFLTERGSRMPSSCKKSALKKVGSASELPWNNFQSGAEVKGEKSLKKRLFICRNFACISENLTRRLWNSWLVRFWVGVLIGTTRHSDGNDDLQYQ
jgi:hypothetical protein